VQLGRNTSQSSSAQEAIMKGKVRVLVVLFCFCVAIPAAYAQGPCTLQTLTGTYVFSARGSSAILDPNSQPAPYHWAGALATFAAIGEVTAGPDGHGTGYYWIRIGSFNTLPDPTPVTLTITELNEDCTGKWQFVFNLAGTANTIEERFIVFDNGREFRSIPTVTGVPPMTWVAEGHRISKPGEPLNTCGPQTANGSYLMAAENLVRFSDTPIYSDALLLRMDISMSGEVNGTLYEKFGPTGNIEIPFSGTITVNPDCSFASTLYAVVRGNPATIPLRGVFFDQGKRLYGMNVNARTVGAQFSVGEGQRIGPW
jgi:hypothetical protein